MRVVRSKVELRAALEAPRSDRATIGLVPTMGALHDGHVSLLRAARAECDFVVISLFVNPAQFGPGEDLDRYPRDEARDVRLAEEAGVDLLYAPPVEEVYPDGFVDPRSRSRALPRFSAAIRLGADPSTFAASPRWSPSSSTPFSPTSPTSAARTRNRSR